MADRDKIIETIDKVSDLVDEAISTNDYTELSSREELNKLYEDTLKGIRDPHFEYWGRNHFIYAAWPEETHLKTIV